MAGSGGRWPVLWCLILPCRRWRVAACQGPSPGRAGAEAGTRRRRRRPSGVGALGNCNLGEKTACLWASRELAGRVVGMCCVWASKWAGPEIGKLKKIWAEPGVCIRPCYEGPIIPFLLGGSLHLKDISISIYPWFNLFDYARTELPIVAPNVETLFLMSADEVVPFYGVVSNLPPQKFFHLKHLELAFVGPRTEITFFHRYLSLVPFLIACPALETFILHV